MPRKMKDSGVEWLGQVPEGWQVARVKHVATIQNGSDPLTEGTVPVYGSGGTSFKTCGEFKNGPTVLLGRKGTIDTPHYIKGRYWNVDTAFDVSMKTNNSLRWFYFLSCCFDYKSYMSQTTVPSMTQSDYNNMIIPLPPLPEQRAIAAYLDERCAKIDTMIAEAKETIEEYRQWKQSLIFEAVTGKVGVGERCRCRKMRDSGVEWIGSVPEGWRISRVKYVAVITNGADPQTEGDVPVYGSGGSSFKTCGEFKDGPTVLLGRKGATLHIPHYIVGRYWNVDTAFDVAMRCGNCLKWFYYLATCFDYKAYMSQTTLPSMTQTDYNSMSIPVPPLLEQRAIAAYLDRKCAAIDRVVAEKEGLIADLEQYKKSLIFECVTGKREVA